MKRRKTSKRKLILWFLLILFLGAAGAATGYGAYLTKKAEKVTQEAQKELERGEKSQKRTKVVNPSDDNISILFLGVDNSEKRNKENPLSDALVLATLNEEEKSMKLVSIPRDSYVYLPTEGYKDKITHAHAFGGVDASVAAVENMFNIPVDYYVRLNFNAFIETVNALDGISAEVPFDLKEQNSNDVDNAIELEKGFQKLNGEEALALARTRKYDSDIERGQRQMDLMKAIFNKASNPSAINKYGSVIDSIGQNMKTNMDFDEMMALKEYVLNRNNITFDTMQLEGEGEFLDDGLYYYMLKDDSLRNIRTSLQTHLDLYQSPGQNDENSDDVSNYADDKEANQTQENPM
ncbi:LytR family transcriptional regulator [Pontibacillus yanchengensis]|uniref:LytR family transcriptional regulator n=1 Tax=Pontibacillus yanchengensis TaxID=462910 RepID=A0A6I5A0K1_9BACI|nr:LCP family protein [Pontibacillus yanchengensis]MYL33960.1 LytR family transcriptional regulator [Pontibacillus yanchengensis]